MTNSSSVSIATSNPLIVITKDNRDVNLNHMEANVNDADKITLSTPYRTISILRSARELLFIIICNCIFSGVTCACLYGFSKRDNLSDSERRLFTVLSLLLSAALGFGIGFLCDKLGMLCRGALLQSRAHSVENIGYIIKGNLSSYCSLLIRNPTNLVVFVFIVSSLCGRFAVAFLGFGFSIEQGTKVTPALYRPDWTNLTLSSSNSTGNEKPPGITYSPRGRPEGMLGVIELAQVARGINLNAGQDIGNVDEATWLNLMRENAKLERFVQGTNHLQVEVTGEKVVHRYKFQDFRGVVSVPAEWEAVIESSCWRYDVLQDFPINLGTFSALQRYGQNISLDVPFLSSNPSNTCVEGTWEGCLDTGIWRWAMRKAIAQVQEPMKHLDLELKMPPHEYETHENLMREAISTIWLMGVSVDYPGSEEDLSFTPLLFNCSVSIQDLPTPKMTPASTDFLENSGSDGATPKVRILGDFLYGYLRESYVDRFSGGEKMAIINWTDPISGVEMIEGEYYRDMPAENGFGWAIAQANQTFSETWLAAYVGRYLANELLFLNDILATIELEQEETTTKAELEIRWDRIGLILGGLAAYQVILAALGLWYCKGKFELLDDISTISSVLGEFSGTTEQKGTDCAGEFKREGNGFRWELTKDKRG